jgi:hypothetical protein
MPRKIRELKQDLKQGGFVVAKAIKEDVDEQKQKPLPQTGLVV